MRMSGDIHSSLNDEEVDKSRESVIIAAKNYGGLLSGCIAVDRKKFAEAKQEAIRISNDERGTNISCMTG